MAQGSFYKTLWLIVFVCFLQQGHSQLFDEKGFDRLTIKDGLTNNHITGIVQDSSGFIWIATKKGLNRYDGNEFRQYYADTNSTSLPQDEIAYIKLLPGNIIGATTTSGFYYINTITLKSNTIIIPPDSLRLTYKVNSLIDFAADQNGYYLLTRSGFYAFDRNNKLVFRYDHYSAKEVESRALAFGYSISAIPGNKYLIGCAGGPQVYDPKTKTLTDISKSGQAALRPLQGLLPTFRSLYSSNEHLFILNTVHYLHYFNPHTGAISATFLGSEVNKFSWRSRITRLNDTTFTIVGAQHGFYFVVYNRKTKTFDYRPDPQFKNIYCNDIFLDTEGRLWIGTKDGLYKQKNTTAHIEKLTIPDEIQESELRFRTMTIANDKIFAGTGAQGLFILDRKSGKVLKNLTFPEISQSARTIMSCLTVNDDTVISGGFSAAMVVNTHNFSAKQLVLPGWDTFRVVFSQLKDRKGNIYISYNDEGFIYRRKPGQSFVLENHEDNPAFHILIPFHITEGSDGNIWFTGHGISRYDVNSGKFNYKIDSFPRIKMVRKEVGGLVITDSHLFFGVAENGLIEYDRKNQNFKQYTRKDGLPDNSIKALYLVNNKIWIGTESGIASFEIDTKKISSYGISDDMPEEIFTGFHFYYDSIHNHLYAPFNNTIVRFDPSTLTKSSQAPRFFIESILINNQKSIYQPDKKIILGPNENNMVVHLASINFDDPWQQQFYFRLLEDGKTSAWQFSGNQKTFIINNIPSGNHSLEFMIVSKTNSWPPKIISINLAVKPPFWKTGWFIGLAIISSIVLLLLFYKARVSRIRENANIDKKLAELEMKGLHAQMNPHFIFNALNSIKEMLWDDEKTNASRYLNKFAQLIRTTLEQSRHGFITVSQCIQHLEQYLEMEKIRFNDFEYSIDYDNNVSWNNIKMAPMLVQPLVENAIWHGLKNQPGEKILQIRFFTDNKYLFCEIEDNGRGIQAGNKETIRLHNPIGIKNIHERLRVLNEKYDMNCSLELINKSAPGEHGTIAILRLTNLKND